MRRTIALCFLVSSCSFAGAQTSPTAAPPVPAAALRDPITKAQLVRLLATEQKADVEASLVHEQLEKKRGTLPAWFPASVWTDVEKQVEAIPFADVALPAYQRHLTSDHAEMVILFFTGPTGQEIAKTLAARANAAVRAGQGANVDQVVAKSVQGDTDLQKLFGKRISELASFQQQGMAAALPAMRVGLPAAEAESGAAYNVRSREVLKAAVASHQAEIAKAQQAAAH